jgi:hypothetical protein
LAVDSDACVPQDLLHDLLDSLPLQIRFQCSVALLENSRVFSRDSGLSATIETSISRKSFAAVRTTFPARGSRWQPALMFGAQMCIAWAEA